MSDSHKPVLDYADPEIGKLVQLRAAYKTATAELMQAIPSGQESIDKTDGETLARLGLASATAEKKFFQQFDHCFPF